ncbi:MAG: thioredoxin [Candidatus Pacearchaeota archaeon]|jgi:thioredoxin 1
MITNELVPELANKEFEKFVKQGIVLVDFFAEWCMPCVMMGPVIEDLAEEFSGKIKVGKINVDDNSELASKFNISSIPNLILFKDGKIVEQLIGARTHEEIAEVIKIYIN